MTLTVSITNGASGLSLVIGSLLDLSHINPGWTLTQQPGSDVVVFQLAPIKADHNVAAQV